MKTTKIVTSAVVLLFAIVGLVSAIQPPSWIDAKSVGGGWSISKGVAVDAQENMYITGEFEENITFGSTTLYSQGLEEVFVAKLSSAGTWLWATSAGGIGAESGDDIALDNTGAIYVVGTTSSPTVTFGSHSYTLPYEQTFVAKLTPSGTWSGVTFGGRFSNQFAIHPMQSIALDNNRNVYVTGEYTGTATFGSFTLDAGSHYLIYIGKLSPSGTWLWVLSAGGSSGGSGKGIAVDASGDPYITGSYSGTGQFGSMILPNNGASDTFVAKLTTNGAWLWARHGGGRSDDYGYDIALDSGGNAYVTGTFHFGAQFGNTIVYSRGGADVFVLKVSPTGYLRWVQTAGNGGSNDYSYGIAVDSAGNSYSTGQVGAGVFIMKLSTGGSLQWVAPAWCQGFSSANSVSLDSQNHPIMTGFFIGTIHFGDATLVSEDAHHVFIAKLGT